MTQSTPRLSLLVAVARNGVIGNRGELPWRLSSDLKRFKQLTLGHPVLMGRKTHESIIAALGKPLPGRVSLVLSRQASEASSTDLKTVAVDASGQVIQVRDVDTALAMTKDHPELFVIGGGEIYALTLPRADRLYWTWVEAEPVGDTFFPPIDWAQWELKEETRVSADARNQYDTTFAIYDRVRSTKPRD